MMERLASQVQDLTPASQAMAHLLGVLNRTNFEPDSIEAILSDQIDNVIAHCQSVDLLAITLIASIRAEAEYSLACPDHLNPTDHQTAQLLAQGYKLIFNLLEDQI